MKNLLSLRYCSCLLFCLRRAGEAIDAVQQANEIMIPAERDWTKGNLQAIMDKTKEFSRNDVNFFTYRFKDGNLRLNARLLNEEIEEEFIQTFVDAFRNSQAETLEIELKITAHNIPLAEEARLFAVFTPADKTISA